MEAAINHHAASGQEAAGPTPHNNDEQSCTHPVGGGMAAGRTNEQTSARKKDVHGCSNERKYAAESKITVSERPESYAMNDVRSQNATTVSRVSGGGRQRHTSSRSLRAGGAGHSQTTTRRKAHQLKTRRPSVWVTQYTLAAAVHACMHARALPRRSRAASDACAIVFILYR